MAIKNDRWIREMAKKGMISPFEEAQVRQDVISYGVSSYGYDLRVGDEYKIFTNINNVIVDPKHFEPKSFIDYKGDYCIVPPNSFALAKSVEYFKIPRNILTICLGKSTYARCFSADTEVALIDGSSVTFEDMVNRYEKGESFWGYNVNKAGKIEPVLLRYPRFIGTDSLIEITLDNEKTIKCTPDHKFMLRNGTMIEAHELRVGHSLMPLYRENYGEREYIYQPLTGKIENFDLNEYKNKIYTDFVIPENIQPTKIDLSKQFELSNETKNHKVSAIKELAGTHDVYCLTVPETANFALEAGVFVQNCGIIVNVTPFEPEWEGIVTIEISNTTPLPAKIYSNEGIAQVLFFESDEPCETSYADKKGKYQSQVGITLPKL